MRTPTTSIAAATMCLILSACGSAASQPPREVAVTDSQNGTTIQVAVGDVVTLSLGSTAWTLNAASDTSILQMQGEPVLSPAPLGTCPPGMGCGTAMARYKALKAGQVTVSGSRVSCGEAMRCVGAEGAYEVTISVS